MEPKQFVSAGCLHPNSQVLQTIKESVSITNIIAGDKIFQGIVPLELDMIARQRYCPTCNTKYHTLEGSDGILSNRYIYRIYVSGYYLKLINRAVQASTTPIGWLFDFTDYDLRAMLPETLPPSYTLSDYKAGKLTIGFDTPLCRWHYPFPDQRGFDEAWSLENLRFVIPVSYSNPDEV